MPTKATKTIKQALSYKPQHAALFERTQVLFNRVASFYFDVIQAHQGVNALGTAQEISSRVVEPTSGIPRQLRMFDE